MKKLFYLVVLVFALGTLSAQTCVTFQPDGSTGKDSYTESVASNANNNGGNYVEFGPLIGTNGGNPDEGRGWIEFDLSSIPSGSTIVSATLSLYANTTTLQGTPAGTSTFGTNNAAYVKRITSPWTELGITGNNQPTTTTVGQVLLPQSTQANQNYDLDITAFAQYWAQNPSQNYGVSLQINTSTPYNGHIFASSDHPDASKHPKLVVCYTVPTSSVPTLSEWGLIILSLLTISLAMVFMLAYQQALIPAGTSVNFAPVSLVGQMPFNRSLLLKVLSILLPVAMIGFVAIHYFVGTNGIVDFTGTMVSTVIVGYMVHLLAEKK